MNIPELVGMGLIRQPKTLQEYLRKKQIKQEAEKAAQEASKKIISELWSKRLDDDLAKLISENFIELF